jgi:hypothetical protein
MSYIKRELLPFGIQLIDESLPRNMVDEFVDPDRLEAVCVNDWGTEQER